MASLCRAAGGREARAAAAVPPPPPPQRVARARSGRSRSHRQRCAARAGGGGGGGGAKGGDFSAEQLAFLERKRRFKAGTGPAMPEASSCPDCGGKGTVVCWKCSGAGVNAEDMAEKVMGNSIENVRQQNGVINVTFFLMQGGPCFVCRGKPECPCRSCEGTGITGFDLANFCGD